MTTVPPCVRDAQKFTDPTSPVDILEALAACRYSCPLASRQWCQQQLADRYLDQNDYPSALVWAGESYRSARRGPENIAAIYARVPKRVRARLSPLVRRLLADTARAAV